MELNHALKQTDKQTKPKKTTKQKQKTHQNNNKNITKKNIKTPSSLTLHEYCRNMEMVKKKGVLK